MQPGFERPNGLRTWRRYSPRSAPVHSDLRVGAHRLSAPYHHRWRSILDRRHPAPQPKRVHGDGDRVLPQPIYRLGCAVDPREHWRFRRPAGHVRYIGWRPALELTGDCRHDPDGHARSCVPDVHRRDARLAVGGPRLACRVHVLRGIQDQRRRPNLEEAGLSAKRACALCQSTRRVQWRWWVGRRHVWNA